MKEDPKKRKPDYPIDEHGRHSAKEVRKGFKIRKTDWPRFVIHNYRGALRRPQL